MSLNADRLYELLPAFYRVKDAGRGELKALLALFAEQVSMLEEDMEQLYDDQFIETCAEWVVPYLGELVGARGVFVFPDAKFSQRAQVANTFAYRRRKGTAAVIEQLARDVTGWDANVVEYFKLLATTQYLNHLRPENLALTSVRSHEALERLNSPFDSVARTADMRSIEARRGKHNIPNVGIFLWRLGSASATGAPAYKLDDRRYLFSALGHDAQLYTKPETEAEISHLAAPVNVPAPITRRELDRELSLYYGRGKSILLNVDGNDVVPETTSPPKKLSELICVCDLSDVKDSNGAVIAWQHRPKDKIAIDPELGRIAFAQDLPAPRQVRVTYHYGLSAEIGGGEYARAASFEGKLDFVIKVPSQQPTIEKALAELTQAFANDSRLPGGIVEIESNDYLFEVPAVTIPRDKKIELRGSDERRPVLALASDMVLSGEEASQLTLNGLLIVGGALRVPAGSNLHALRIRHCTLAPGASPAIQSAPAKPRGPRLIIEAAQTECEIEHSIVAAIRAPDAASVSISNSIVDAGGESELAYAALNGAGAPLEIKNSTVIGQVHTLMLGLASNTIFLGRVNAKRLQQGCVRFSYLPLDSQAPRNYQCQSPPLRPRFTSLRYGDAGYCQLGGPEETRRGAEDGSQMGAFHDLFEPQREANLRTCLQEYLRFGLEAGIFYAS